MAFGHKDLIGRKAYSRDGVKLVKIKRAMDDCDYLIVERRLTTDLVVPIEAFQPSEDGVVVPRMRWLLEMAREGGVPLGGPPPFLVSRHLY